MKKFILIVTSSFDKTVDYIMKKFSKENFIRLNIDKLNEYKISISYKDDIFKISLKDNKNEINDLFNSIKSIYYRKIFLPDLSEYETSYQNFMQREIYSFVTGFVESFEGKILTSPTILKKVENKIYQLKVAKKLNFLIPSSLITNDSKKANNFSLNKLNVIKPLSTGKITNTKCIYTNLLYNKHIENIELSPIYLQDYIQKTYELRIIVINNEFYCIKIIANNKIDWRINENKNKYELIEIPYKIRKQCNLFLKECNLKFGVFDYIVFDNKYYFLECNPNGQWLWLEQILNLDISNKIIEYLND